MKTITIKEGCSTPVNIGEKGENGVGAVLFDYSEWLNDFGNGAISLLVKRKGDSSAYPVVLSTADGIATWTISDTDTAVQGYGKAEYIFTIDDKIAKSAVFSFFVAQDLGTAGDPPDPYESWIDTLTALGGETLINAQRAEAAESGAETAQTAAETAATNAESSATNAAQSAGAARDMAASALSSADSASASATSATASATAASESATQAAASATSAAQSATAASGSASSAASSATTAQTAATNAQQSATNAATSVTQSANNAAQAIEAASDAEEADRIATQAATSATQSANNAAQSASNASQSATQAASSATNAAASATSASESAERAESAAASVSAIQLPVDTASGAIASFPDGADSVPVEALTVSLEPIQDLNGQSSPYPAGGGKNLLDPAKTSVHGTDGSHYGIHVEFNADTETFTFTGTATSSSANASFNFLQYSDNSLSGKSYVVQYFDKTGTGVVKNIYGFRNETEAAVAIVLDLSGSQTVNFSIKISVAATSQSAWSPYSNICPITGHTSVGVWRSGVNVFDADSFPLTAGYVSASDGTLSNGGTSVSKTADYIPCGHLAGQTITINHRPGYGYSPGVAFYDADKTFISGVANASSSSTAAWSMTVPATAEYMRITVPYQQTNIQIEVGSTASAYEEYNAVHITIPLGQTVFGGTVDVVNGVLTVDRVCITPTVRSLQSINSHGIANFGVNITGASMTGTDKAKAICSALKYQTSLAADTTEPGFLMSNDSLAYFRLQSTTASTTEEATTWITTNNVQLCYILATPITIDLTDIPTISTLLGQNNIWSDSGDVSVEYRADIQRYIAKVIAEAIS